MRRQKNPVPKMINAGKFVFLAAIAGSVYCASGSDPARIAGSRIPFPTPASRVALQPCKLPGLPEEVRCGSYEVYEDREAKSGRKIALNIVVVPALSSKPASDPLFWLEGGPGGAATRTAFAARSFLSDVRKTHDLVFVDQRGTGESNPLQCDVGDSPDDLQKFFGGTPLRESLRACREALEKIANLKLYTTPIAMDDLDDVRDALGYNKINIGGLSYGSLASQVYLRMHGDHVRTVFVGGVATPNIKQPLQFARSAQHALDLLFEDCAADKDCHESFPKLHEEFDAVLARFKDGPLRVDLIRPSDKQKQSVLIYRDSFTDRVKLMLYNTRGASYLPVVIHKAFQNDFVPFESAAILTNPGGGIARGMYFTVTCSEGARFITDEDLTRETASTFIGDYHARVHREACNDWPRGDIPANYIEPVKSNAPVLMIVGEVDGASGPWFPEAAIKSLPNGRLIKIRYYGHQFGDPCTKSIFSKFIENGSAVGIDASCTEAIRRPPFPAELPSRFMVQ
jgi:pimeloyl-ACP methyl ester carboxylesterase